MRPLTSALSPEYRGEGVRSWRARGGVEMPSCFARLRRLLGRRHLAHRVLLLDDAWLSDGDDRRALELAEHVQQRQRDRDDDGADDQAQGPEDGKAADDGEE